MQIEIDWRFKSLGWSTQRLAYHDDAWSTNVRGFVLKAGKLYIRVCWKA